MPSATTQKQLNNSLLFTAVRLLQWLFRLEKIHHYKWNLEIIFVIIINIQLAGKKHTHHQVTKIALECDIMVKIISNIRTHSNKKCTDATVIKYCNMKYKKQDVYTRSTIVGSICTICCWSSGLPASNGLLVIICQTTNKHFAYISTSFCLLLPLPLVRENVLSHVSMSDSPSVSKITQKHIGRFL